MKEEKFEEEFELYNRLLPLKGIDMRIAIPYFIANGVNFKPMGYNKEFGGFPEDLIALSFDSSRPTNRKGADFKEGDSKSIKAKLLKNDTLSKKQKDELKNLIDPDLCKTKLRNCGNTPIGEFEDDDLLKTDLWQKMYRLILVYQIDGIIIDIRIFSSEKFKNVLINDYNFIRNGENEKTEILTIKKYKNNKSFIQIKKYRDVFLSKSIYPDDYTNNITNQQEYIESIFSKNLEYYRNHKEEFKKNKKDKVKIMLLNSGFTVSDMIEFRELIDKNIKGHEFITSDDSELQF